MAILLCFEGIDGSGKTSQIELIQQRLEGTQHRVHVLSYPVYESFFGVELGHILSGRNEKGHELDPKSMALWYALDRWHDYQKQHSIFTDPQGIILINRYTLSSMVYQGARSGNHDELPQWVEALEHDILGLPRPDLYFILDMPPSAGRDNVKKKGLRAYVGLEHDIYEQDFQLQLACREMYLKFAKERNDAVVIPCFGRGKLRTRNAITKEIFAELTKRKLL